VEDSVACQVSERGEGGIAWLSKCQNMCGNNACGRNFMKKKCGMYTNNITCDKMHQLISWDVFIIRNT
jgi:hypothetical protein